MNQKRCTQTDKIKKSKINMKILSTIDEFICRVFFFIPSIIFVYVSVVILICEMRCSFFLICLKYIKIVFVRGAKYTKATFDTKSSLKQALDLCSVYLDLFASQRMTDIVRDTKAWESPIKLISSRHIAWNCLERIAIVIKLIE